MRGLKTYIWITGGKYTLVQSETVIDVAEEKLQCFVASAAQELKQFRSAWPRLKLNTKIGLHTTHHHTNS